MGIDGYKAVDPACQQCAQHLLTHGLAGVKRFVLAHVGQVGDYQHNASDTAAAQRVHRQTQIEDLGVGAIKNGVQHDCLRALRRAHQRLPIGKRVTFDHPEVAGQRLRQPRGRLGVLLEPYDANLLCRHRHQIA
jgi:hypothetical protein